MREHVGLVCSNKNGLCDRTGEPHEEFDNTVTENPDYIRCLEGSHLGLIHKYAAIWDGIYSPWNYEENKSYIQANFAARFVGELVAPFHKLSLVHKSTALSEVAKQKLVYQQWLHIDVEFQNLL